MQYFHAATFAANFICPPLCQSVGLIFIYYLLLCLELLGQSTAVVISQLTRCYDKAGGRLLINET